MTGLILTFLMVAAVFIAVSRPFFGRAPAPLGRGQEDDAPVRRWETERARLIAAMRDNDLALAEGRLDPATREATAARLAEEAERVLARLRAARGQFAPVADPDLGAGRAGVAWPVAALALTVALGVGMAQMARWQDIDLTGSPHADGRVPLGNAMPGEVATLPPVMGADGAPDIAAMVARLETRVAEGDAAADEIKMLLRSYDTLGRLEEASAVLDAALIRFPDDPELQLGWLRAAISLSRIEDPARGLEIAARLIAADPDLLEARWYRSLLLVADDRPLEARAELLHMAPRLPEDSPARNAVIALIAELPPPPG